MSNQKKWLLSLALVLGAITLAAILATPGEPRYQRRRLHDWMSDFHSADSERRGMAAAAIRQMGHETIPFLTNSLARRSSLSLRLLHNRLIPKSVLKKIGPSVKWQSPITESQEAAMALKALGPDAAPAIPALIDALSDNDYSVSMAASEALAAIGPAALPPLRARLGSNREEAIGILRVFGLMGETAAPALPDISPYLASQNGTVVDRATYSMIQIGPLSAPFVTNHLASTNRSTRIQAANILAQLGQRAHSVKDSLLPLLSDPEPAVRYAGLAALSTVELDRARTVAIWLQGLQDANAKNAALALRMLTIYPTNVRRYSNEIAAMAARPEKDISETASDALSRFRAWPPGTPRN